MKRPSFQFYPADWRKDPALSSCSLAARGLWIEMMCIAHESDQYGTLLVNGNPMNEAQLARQVGETPVLVKRLLRELESAGVFSRTEAGAIYSRRMVKDERNRQVRAAGGAAGAEFGELGKSFGKMGGRPTRETGDKKPPLQEVKEPPLYPPPSSSSSTSVVPPLPPQGGRQRKKASTPCPDTFDVTTELWQWCIEIGVAESRIEPETAQFLEHHKAKDSRFADWTMAWRTWMRNVVKFGGGKAAA